MQQDARLGVHPLNDDGNDEHLEDGVRKIGIHGEAGETRPNALVGVVPSVGDVQWPYGVGATVVVNLVKAPGLAGARSMNGVDGSALDGLEVGGLRRGG